MIEANDLEALASLATAIGILLVLYQIEMSKQQTITSFEDGLVQEYREVISGIPVQALLGEKLTPEDQEKALGSFYKYVDLCNTQIFYKEEKRIRPETWKNWEEGILTHFKRPAFDAAWQNINQKVQNKNDSERDFDELRNLLNRRLYQEREE